MTGEIILIGQSSRSVTHMETMWKLWGGTVPKALNRRKLIPTLHRSKQHFEDCITNIIPASIQKHNLLGIILTRKARSTKGSGDYGSTV